MKKFVLTCLALAVCTSTLGQETRTRGTSRSGEAAGYATRDASVMSMMGWGLAIAVGIATLFSLLDNNSTAHGGHAH
jgi:hypothetical protein